MLKSLYQIAKHNFPDSPEKKASSLWKYRLKFVVRGCLYHTHLERLQQTLNAHTLSALQKNDHRFLEKPMRPYISVNNTPSDCVQWILDHYAFLPEALFQKLYTQPNGILLKTVEVDELPYEIRLMNDAAFQKEGELTLKLLNEHQENMYSVSFVIHTNAKQQREMAIGGLQGPASTPENNHRIKRLTKVLHGLRPKDLMVKLAMMIANAWQVEQILAVSNQGHIYRAKRYQSRKRVLANYDAHWSAMGGEEYSKDFYRLPLTEPRKTPEEISRPKRAMYRRRYEWLDETAQEFANKLSLND